MDRSTQKFKFHKTTAVRIIFLSAVFCLSLFFIVPVLAQTGTPNPVTAGELLPGQQFQDAGLAQTDLRVIIARIIRVAFGLVGLVFLGLTLYGGYTYMTAGGEERKIASAKQIILNGAIGLLVMLSAYSIVSFIIGKWTDAVNQGDGGNIQVAGFETNFFGTGGLGSVIKDHYPGRDETDVPRNTRIIISFRKPFLASSVINDTNGNGVFGDCTAAANFNWETNCDSLKLDNNIFSIEKTESNEMIRGAAALISYEGNQAYTVTIRPYDALGSDSDPVRYSVRVGGGILLDDPANNNPSIFQGRSSNFYEWQFTCSTLLDRTPPQITGVFPRNTEIESRNSVIQINFSKPMDPAGLQGGFSAATGYYMLNGDNVYLKSGNSTIPIGNFRLVNNYRTLEFTPGIPCGQNACGGTVYCMPVCDQSGSTCTIDDYEMLIRAAATFTTSSFESIPYSGAADASGNALDGNKNGKVDVAPRTGDVFSAQKQPDNYFWSFKLQKEIDTTAPFIQQVTPGPEAQNVGPRDVLSLLFSERMRADSLYNLDIQENPVSPEPLCKVPRSTFNEDGTTLTRIDHCPFISSERHYYYPVVDSNVQDVHFNCFYPGIGPVGLNASGGSLVCDSNGQNCCPVSSDQSSSFCCNGMPTESDKNACLNALRATSP